MHHPEYEISDHDARKVAWYAGGALLVVLCGLGAAGWAVVALVMG